VLFDTFWLKKMISDYLTTSSGLLEKWAWKSAGLAPKAAITRRLKRSIRIKEPCVKFLAPVAIHLDRL